MNTRTRLTAILLTIILTITSIPPFGPLYICTKAIHKDTGYEITYEIQNQWSKNASVQLTIANQSEEPMENWKLQFHYEPEIVSMWNASYEKNNQTYTITPMSYNTAIPAKSIITIGFTASHADDNFKEPEEYVIDYDGKNKEEASGDARQEEDGMQSGLTVKEEWKGLRYALFTAGETDTSMKAGKVTINGDVHTNQNFHYEGGALTISGLLHTAGISQISTADQGTSIGTKYQHGSLIDMPDLISEIKEAIKKDGTLHQNALVYKEPLITLNKPAYTEDTITVHTSQFIGEGILMAKNSIVYNTGNTATPDNSKLMLAAEQGDITLNGTDITLNGVLYAPNGTVIINAGNMTLNGRIIANQVIFNGTNLTINSNDGDYSMLPFLPDHQETKPDITLTASGTHKVNRKVVLDAEGITKQELDKETIKWEIVNVTGEGEAPAVTAIDKNTETNVHKELLFRQTGSYLVRLTVGSGEAARTAQTTLDILDDEAPIADFLVESRYMRNEEGIAEITITDASYSPDGDSINKRIWTIYYDANNNKKFEDDEAEVISSKNKTEITYKTKKVGRYKVELTVQEAIEPTISSLLEPDAYKTGTTSQKQENKKIFLVDNEAPETQINLTRQKAADIVYTYGNASKEQLSVYQDAAKNWNKS